MANDVKDLMESSGYKFVNIINELHTETYANDDMSIVFNNEKHTIAVNDYRNWRFINLDAQMVELLHNAFYKKGWFKNESNI